jgi:hypothetical protein
MCPIRNLQYIYIPTSFKKCYRQGLNLKPKSSDLVSAQLTVYGVWQASAAMPHWFGRKMAKNITNPYKAFHRSVFFEILMSR